SRSSSGGESRIIRMGYGGDEIYTRMAQRSLARWQELFEATRQPLFHRTGVLWIARNGDPYSEATRQTLERVGIRTEILPAPDLPHRYPQIVLDAPGVFAIFEPESGALMARRAVAVVRDDFIQRGGEYSMQAVLPPSGRGKLAAVRTADGEEISAGAFVF